MKIFFLRHGQTVVNTQAQVHKRNDEAELNALGIQQAGKLAVVCKKENVSAVYCSDETRALQTAEIIARKLQVTPVTIPSLAERDWGEWAGRPWADIQATLQPMSLPERYEFTPPAGESWKHMDERYQDAIKEIVERGGDAIAVVTHGGALRALMPVLKNQPKETSFQYDFKNGSVTCFEYENGRWSQLSENDISHI